MPKAADFITNEVLAAQNMFIGAEADAPTLGRKWGAEPGVQDPATTWDLEHS